MINRSDGLGRINRDYSRIFLVEFQDALAHLCHAHVIALGLVTTPVFAGKTLIKKLHQIVVVVLQDY